MPLIIVLLGVGVLLLLIAWARLNAFLAFVLVALGVGLASGLPALAVVQALQEGIGATLGFLVPILGFGAMLGRLVADSGAAQRITMSLVDGFGLRRVQLALVISGFIVGIPLFYSVGFVMLVPLVFSIAVTTGLPLLYVGLPMLASLSVAHGYLPPHPAPTDIAVKFGADMGLTLGYGILVAIPAITVAGIWFSRRIQHLPTQPDPKLLSVKPLSEEALPALWSSLLAALSPVLLIGGAALALAWLPEESMAALFLQFLGNPIIAMLLALLLAVDLLGLRRGKSMREVMMSLEEAVKGVTMVLLIIAGAGALKAVLEASGISDYLAQLLSDLPISPIILAWLTAACIRVCVGSATVAALTTAGMLAHLVATIDTPPELMVLAIGAGSLMFSHVNDGGFWLFKEYFGLSLRDTLRSWSVMETLVSVMGLLGVLLLSLWVG